jgi:hypothetical protein
MKPKSYAVTVKPEGSEYVCLLAVGSQYDTVGSSMVELGRGADAAQAQIQAEITLSNIIATLGTQGV